MKLTRFAWCLTLLFAPQGFSQNHHHQKLVSFDAPGTGSVGSGTYPTGINARGEIVGTMYDNKRIEHGFVRSRKGEFTVFDVANVANGGETFPKAINNSGVIVGYAFDPHVRVNHAFIRTPDGQITLVDYPQATPTGGTVLLDINNKGEAVGYFLNSYAGHQGFIRNPDGTFIPVNDTQPGQTEVFSINDSGAVAAILYPPPPKKPNGFLRTSSGNIVDFNCPGGKVTNIYIINDGETQGSCLGLGQPDTAYERAPDGTFSTYESPTHNPAMAQINVNAANERGTAVGNFYALNAGVNPSLPVSVSFAHFADGTLVTVHVPPNVGSQATGINVRGHVTGFWLEADNKAHGYIWTSK